ncbi:hypothetical protein [Halobacillus karajensis]|uniref:hypothetical protein n=1 Tax=Halobacillus karajensis TaxID=195088 RepID=UPI00045D522E|nr:hypothetical protein [Halobacillus karajensis]CDQ21727.1 hypothetical protein BN982_04136 [Halobacillus karajensis]
MTLQEALQDKYLQDTHLQEKLDSIAIDLMKGNVRVLSYERGIGSSYFGAGRTETFELEVQGMTFKLERNI